MVVKFFLICEHLGAGKAPFDTKCAVYIVGLLMQIYMTSITRNRILCAFLPSINCTFLQLELLHCQFLINSGAKM